MAAATKNLTLERGVGLLLRLFVTNSSDDSVFDLTNYTAQAQMREKPLSLNKIADFTATVVDVVTGELTVTLTDAQVAALPVGVWAWDLFIHPSLGRSTRLLAGKATVVASVSRS